MNLPVKGKVNRDGRPQANRRVRRGCCDNHHDAAVYEETGLLPQARRDATRTATTGRTPCHGWTSSDTAGSPDRLEVRTRKLVYIAKAAHNQESAS